MSGTRRWKLVSTAPLDAGTVRRWLGDRVEGELEVVVVEPRTAEAAADAVVDADVVLGDFRFEVPLNRAVIERMERCRLIQQPSVGYEQIDVEAAAERGIPVANAAGGNDVAVAEHTVMVGLALLKPLLWLDAETRRGVWHQLDAAARGYRELAGKVWGIVGLGRIGREVARRLRPFQVELLYHDPVAAPPEVETELGVSRVGFDELLARSDVVSLHVPLLAETRHLVDARALAAMKPTAVLINVARGEVVDEDALVAALRERRLAGAALDVFHEEPLPADHPLTGLDNVILTPHTAGTPIEAQVRIMEIAADNVRRVLAGEPPVNVVNGVGGGG